jgi:hypothetical protein
MIFNLKDRHIAVFFVTGVLRMTVLGDGSQRFECYRRSKKGIFLTEILF